MRGAHVAAWGGLGVIVLGVATLAGAADVTDRDRLWRNFTRETASVDTGQLRFEVRGLTEHDRKSQDSPQVILRGFPAGDKDQIPVGADVRRDDIREVSGGIVDLMGSYGLFKNTEVGFDVVGIIQGLRFADKSKENEADMGDMLLYGKYRYPIDDHLAVGGGVEQSIPTGEEHKRLGTGEPGTSPFVNARYSMGRYAISGHAGYQFNEGALDNVFNWSADAVIKGAEYYSVSAEITGRHFEYGGIKIDDVSAQPGINYYYTKSITIRPTGIAGITDAALQWGLGVGFAMTF